nr:hypothetical protein [Tanacetum cinerariifolium]
MAKFSPKLVFLVFVFVFLSFLHANTAFSDNGFRYTERSSELIQAWRQRVVVFESRRKLRTAKAPPAPKLSKTKNVRIER